jgi:4a-hydroxytetrahydrobiopterin dehydratase
MAERLNTEAIGEQLKALNSGLSAPEKNGAWRHLGDRITRVFQFPDFVTAFAFMTEAALIAERMNHHPEWSNVYGRVSVELSTHDAGGLTELDFELARAMNRAAARHL